MKKRSSGTPGDTVTKLLPVSLYDTAGMEAWLERMAEKGLILTEFLGERASFRAGEPTVCRCRMEPRPGALPEPDGEMRALYAASGWEYICADSGENFFFWRSTRPDARELHTDPVAESYGYQKLRRRYRNRCLWSGLGTLAALALCGGLAALGGTSALRLVRDNTLLIQWGWCLFLLAMGVYAAAAELGVLRRTLQSLSSGVPAKPARWALSPRGRQRLLWWGLAVLLVGMLSGAAAELRPGESYSGPLTDCPERLPYVSAHALGCEAGDDAGAAWGRSALADRWSAYEGPMYSYTFSNGWGTARACATQVYRLRLPLLQKKLARELLDTQPRQGAEVTAAPLADDRFDGAWYGTDQQGVQYLAVCRDGAVLYMAANVPVDLRTQLELFSQVLDAAAS